MSSDDCYAMVRGSVLRVTRLDSAGYPDSLGQPLLNAVSKAVSKVTIDEVVDSSRSEMLRNDEDQRRILLRRNEQTIRYLTDINFLKVDPGVLSIVAGVPLVTNAQGDVVGFDARTRMKATSFALEVWSTLSGAACADGPRWGYTVFPFLKGGWLSGFAFANSLVTFNLTRAATQRGSKWGHGPYVVDDSPEPVSRNTHWRNRTTSLAPPQPTNGIEEVFEGGNASMTTDNVLDGEFVVTSSRIVDGGEA